jgi:hypothetical protein
MMLSVEPSIISSGGEGGGGEEDIAAAMVNNTLTDDSDILGSDHPIPINDSIDDDDEEGDDGEGGGGDDSTSIVESLPSSDILASISPIFNNDDDIDDLYEQKYYTTHGDEDGDEDDGGSNMSYYSNDDHDQEEEEEASLYDDDDDLSLGFPPGYVVTLDDLDPLQNIGKVSLHHQDNKTTKMQEKNNNNNTKGCDPRTIPSTRSVNVNPSIVPSFFFCPLTRSIMRDPVITPDGYTYERRAILRYLCLGLGLDPMSNNPLQHVDLVEDRLVRQAIDKARKEAWIRYVVELPNIDDENDNNDKVDDDDDDDIVQQQSGGIMYDNHKDVEDELNDSKIDQIIDIEMRGRDDDDDNNDKSDNKEDVPSLIASKKKSKSRRDHRHHHHQEDADENNTSVSTPTLSNNTEQLMLSPSSQSNHGWGVPLGVHRITCMSPGLLVTADVHRRSNIVQRKIIHNSLTKDDDDNDDKEEMVGSYRKSKQKTKKKKKGGSGIKIVTGVKTRDLLLPSGSYVEILETRVHGGRVRGRIVWEEEVITEYDHDVILHLEEIEVRQRAMTRPKQQQHQNNLNNDSPSKKRIGRKATVGAAVRKASAAANKTLFRRKSISGMGGNGGLFASDLFDASMMGGGGGGVTNPPERGNESIGEREDIEEDLVDTSPSPLTTIKYSGWISLQWAGSEDNKERDEVIERRRRTSGKVGESNPETALSSVAADEDEGPWSQPLPLGVYRIGVLGDNDGNVVSVDDDHRDAGHLPLHDAPDDESNAIDYLVPGQCIEIVETQVLVVKKKKKKKKRKNTKDGGIYTKYSSVDAMGEQVVRARCMVPVVIVPPTSMNNVIAKPQRKYRNGWITLFGGEGTKDVHCSVAAFPIPLGAYVFKADDPLLLDDNKLKFPIGSVVEVVTTRIEFDDKEREGMHHSVAVRGLLASGGYVTLYAISIGASGTSLRLSGFVRSVIYAESVPLGTYRITQPTNLSSDILKNAAIDDVVTQLDKNERVRIVETRVEDGCVRGRVVEVFSARRQHRHVNSKDTQMAKTIGWISLFEPPSLRWAEHITEEKEVP